MSMLKKFMGDGYDEWLRLRENQDPKPSTLRELVDMVIPAKDQPLLRLILRREGFTSLTQLADRYDEWVIEMQPKSKSTSVSVRPRKERKAKPDKKPAVIQEKPHLEYNPMTGEINQTTSFDKSPFNAGWEDKYGTRLLRWQGKPVSFARLCWFLYTGEWVARVERIDKSAGYAVFNLRPVLHTVTL